MLNRVYVKSSVDCGSRTLRYMDTSLQTVRYIFPIFSLPANSYCARRVLSSGIPPAANPSAASASLNKEVEECYNRLDLSFTNAKEAFKSKTNRDLFRGLLVFRLCTIDFLVQHNQRLLQIMRKMLGRTLFTALLKSTFYGHFVAGETHEEVEKTSAKLARFGVKAILDYSVESDISQGEAEDKAVEGIVGQENLPEAITSNMDKKALDQTHQQYTVHKEFGDRRLGVVSARTYFYASEKECDKNVEVFCDCIDAVAKATNKQGFTAIKLTALGRPQLLLKLSETIAQTQNLFKTITGSTWENLVLRRISKDDFMKQIEKFGIKCGAIEDWFKIVDFDNDGFVDFYEWVDCLTSTLICHVSSAEYQKRTVGAIDLQLNRCEQQECSNMMQRLVTVADCAATRGIRIMTYFQPAISRLTIALMRKYNKEGGQILNTYQAYLKNTLNAMSIDMHIARRENFHFGAKLVRGAYMEQERKRAAAIGYEDPVNENYEATSDMYHRCLQRLVDERMERGAGHVSVMVASHNEATVRNAVQLMKDRSIAPSERVVCFAQLYGMCDQVSFSLGQAGYSVYKYLPFGPVEEVLPYLSRRALENGSMLKNVTKERSLMWSELKRRIMSGQLIHPVPMPAESWAVNQ
uniref:Proline dehydrogenase n=1 Tax=Ditylenchus dipsaci TaxID=166011 RepID=A0A915DEH1_9BILA